MATGPALAYPERPVRFIVGFGAGGTSDIVARLMAQELSAALGQPVPVESRTGAGGNAAFEAAAKAEPDGHTVVLASPAFAVNPALYGDRLRWKQEELAPVILLGFTPVAVIVRPESPARDVRDLVGSARGRGGGALLADISGSGTSSHLANILFQAAARLRSENVPYTGGAAPFLDLMTFPAPETVSYLEAGRVRVLALAERTAAPALRHLPTLADAGLPDAAMSTWYGVLAPRRAPAEARAALHRAAAAALARPEVRAKMLELGVNPAGGTPEDFADLIRRETARWARVVAETGVRVEQTPGPARHSLPHPPEEHTMAAPPSARRDRLNPHFPKLVEMTNSHVYGDVWERKQLSKRDRSMVTIAALVALGWKEQVESHIARGLGNGLSRDEIAEIITHLSLYAGWPAAMTASHVAVDVFEAEDARKS